MRTDEFFEAVYHGRLSDLDTYNQVKGLTNSFEPKLLQMLCDDFDYDFIRRLTEMLFEVGEAEIYDYAEKNKISYDVEYRADKSVYISDYFDEPPTNRQLESKKAIEVCFEDRKKAFYAETVIAPSYKFASFCKLRDILIELKRKHTSTESKFDDKPIGTFNPHNQKHNPDKSETVKFFESIESGELLKLDIHNKIQKLTDEYDEDKLNLLCDEFDSYIFVKYENWRASYSEDDVHKRIDKYHDKGIKLPIKGDEKHKYQWPFIRDFFLVERFGKPISDEEHEKHLDELFGEDRNKHDVIDDNVLLGGFYYATDNKYLQDLRDILVKLKKKYTSSVYRFDEKPKDLQVNSQYINWLKSDESRKQFIKALKEQNFIKARETEAIINYHFKPHREQNGKPEPIIWLDNQNLLVYLFRNLYRKYFVNPAGKKWQIVSEHFIKEDGERFKVPSLTQEAYKQKDGVLPANANSIKTIDKIVDRLIPD